VGLGQPGPRLLGPARVVAHPASRPDAAVGRRDAGPIERARRILGERYRAGVVVYRGERIERLTETVFAVPDWWLLGFEE